VERLLGLAPEAQEGSERLKQARAVFPPLPPQVGNQTAANKNCAQTNPIEARVPPSPISQFLNSSTSQFPNSSPQSYQLPKYISRSLNHMHIRATRSACLPGYDESRDRERGPTRSAVWCCASGGSPLGACRFLDRRRLRMAREEEERDRQSIDRRSQIRRVDPAGDRPDEIAGADSPLPLAGR